MLKLSIPVIDGSNGRFGFEYLGCYSLVSLFDGLVHFFLLDGEVTFPEGAWIIPGVAMFLDLAIHTYIQQVSLHIFKRLLEFPQIH